MAKLRYFIDESQPNSKNLVPIIAVISVAGKYKKKNMGKTVHPDDWIKDPKPGEPLKKKIQTQRVKKSPLYPIHKYNGWKETNALLDSFEAETNEFLRECGSKNIPVTPELVERYLKGKKPEQVAVKGFWDAFDDFIQWSELNKSPNTTHCRQTIYNVIKSYQDETGNQVTFDNMDMTFFDSLQRYVLLDMEADANYFATIIKRLKTFLNWATIRNYYSGTEHLKFKATEKPLPVIALTEQELKQLYEHQFESKRDQQIRDVFYFGCKTGLRYIDLKNLSTDHIQGGFIKKVIEKTSYEAVIFILPELQRIIDRYAGGYFVLPVKSNQKNNEYLKEVCRAAEINTPTESLSYPKGQKEVKVLPKCDMVSSHTARKTFVSIAHAKGMPDQDIMKISGIRSYSTLKRYLDISPEHIQSTMEKHLG